MIQALPDSYLQEMNEIEMIIGQPLFFNYYTLFSVQTGEIGFYKAKYSLSAKEFTFGAMLGILLFLAISVGGIYACVKKYKDSQNEKSPKVTVKRQKRELNKRRYMEESGLNIGRSCSKVEDPLIISEEKQ
jgi:hypothetical protein